MVSVGWRRHVKLKLRVIDILKRWWGWWWWIARIQFFFFQTYADGIYNIQFQLLVYQVTLTFMFVILVRTLHLFSIKSSMTWHVHWRMARARDVCRGVYPYIPMARRAPWPFLGAMFFCIKTFIFSIWGNNYYIYIFNSMSQTLNVVSFWVAPDISRLSMGIILNWMEILKPCVKCSVSSRGVRSMLAIKQSASLKK